jgi:hypothetical protein
MAEKCACVPFYSHKRKKRETPNWRAFIFDWAYFICHRPYYLPFISNPRMILPVDTSTPPSASGKTPLRIRILIAFGIIIGLLIFGELWRRISQASELRGLEGRMGAQVTQLSQESIQLSTQLAGAQSDEAVAAWAHSQAKMVQPGEVLVMPLTPAAQATPTPAPSANSADVPHWKIWWEWMWSAE